MNKLCEMVDLFVVFRFAMILSPFVRQHQKEARLTFTWGTSIWELDVKNLQSDLIKDNLAGKRHIFEKKLY